MIQTWTSKAKPYDIYVRDNLIKVLNHELSHTLIFMREALKDCWAEVHQYTPEWWHRIAANSTTLNFTSNETAEFTKLLQ